ncbi:hypothetical protein MesoLjLc_51260 [Mesorhizobium sp. L-8-10]|uniref:hypothetical protein n=1 Tax=Mesorhizobium sp. L-8-10 TaxID=2744523 RepID=UPI00192832CF|nr:hypothetical protein [Mesorhizobium sp. L-8-10]BCH33196.1 hypothetical protein MesoLjLc_51260 [Mesorhizobium sp. L-8-10]
MAYTLVIRKSRIPVATLADASRIYSERRDASGLGASRWPEGQVFEGDRLIGRVSYNGRIWSPGDWRPDDVPIYDNRKAVSA